MAWNHLAGIAPDRPESRPEGCKLSKSNWPVPRRRPQAQSYTKDCKVKFFLLLWLAGAPDGSGLRKPAAAEKLDASALNSVIAGFAAPCRPLRRRNHGRISLFEWGALIFSSARSEIFVDQPVTNENQLRRSGIFRGIARQMSPLRGSAIQRRLLSTNRSRLRRC